MLLAADGVLAGFLFTRGSFLLQAPDWIGIVATASILVSIALALLGFATRDYVTAPKPEAVAQRAGATEAWLKWRFVPNLLRAIDANRGKLERKARLIGLSLLSLLVGVLAMGAYLGFTIVVD